ncbi:hypothetical protein TSH7_19340, partial [Azospirillum sp. TSH7]
MKGQGTVRRRVHLVRHGEVAYFDRSGQPHNPRDVPLTPAGLKQVEALAHHLAAVTIDRAVCSGLPRTRETAGILIAGRGLPLEEDEQLSCSCVGGNGCQCVTDPSVENCQH